MRWSPLMPAAGAKNAARAAQISLRCILGGQRCRPGLLVAIRPAGFIGVDWLTKGQAVQVALGGGEHAGWIRIAPNGPFRLGANGGRGQGVLQLRLPFPPGIEPASRPITVVEFEYSDGWIEFALPAGWYTQAPPRPVAEPDHSAASGKMVAPARPEPPRPTGNATPPSRGVELAAAAAAIAAKKAARA